MANEIKTIFLPGPVGKLEALLNQGQPDATHAALVCHPHPLFGGTMHNKVVFHAMKTINSFGFPVLRFNFRGAGLSEGQHDQGRGEVDDIRAALDWLDSEFHLPILFCGFSFGAATGLRASCADDRVKGLISLGTPVAVEGRVYTYQFLQGCTKPKLFVSGANDQYSTQANLKNVYEMVPEPKELVFVEGADHFFEGQLPKMQAAIQHWIQEFFKPEFFQPGSQVEAS
ncbi:MAG TPA: alpha/beta fold hydrolase [Candidatus Solibacter sp.]|nr:alpha/beta fold hydrolase [Candidatus Solibacter sp.]